MAEGSAAPSLSGIGIGTNAPGPTNNAPTNTQTPKAETPKAGTIQSQQPPKTWKHKVDGQEVEWKSEADLVRDAGLGRAAFKRMEEASKLRQQAETFLEAFKKDPMKALENPLLGLDDAKRREVIEKYYADRYLKADQQTPEQRRIAELENKLAEKAQAEEQAKQQANEQQQVALREQYREHYQKIVIDALDKSTLPKTPFTVARMAFYMNHAIRNKLDMPMELIVNRVQQDYASAFKDLTQGFTPEALVAFLGPDLAKKVNQYHLQEYRKRQSAVTGAVQSNQPETPKRQSKPNTGTGWKSVQRYFAGS